MITANLNDLRISPRKVKLVTGLIKGKKVPVAIDLLTFKTKKSSDPILKLLKSALANAKNQSIDTENLFVKSITVDQGATLFRRRPVSRGRAHPIKKRTSHVSLVLDEKAVKVERKAKVKASAFAKATADKKITK